MTIPEIRLRMNEKEYAAGVALARSGLMRLVERREGKYVYEFDGHSGNRVAVSGTSAVCGCGAPRCRHALAALILSRRQAEADEKQEREAAEILIGALEGALPPGGTLALEATLVLTDDAPRLGLRIGEDRLYVVRSIPQLLECKEKGDALPFGKGFVYQPRWMRFDDGSERLLNTLSDFTEGARENLSGAEARLMFLRPRALRAVLDRLSRLDFRVVTADAPLHQAGIQEKPLEITFMLQGAPGFLTVCAEGAEGMTAITEDCAYILRGGALFRVPEGQRRLARAVTRATGPDGRAMFRFSASDSPLVLSDLTGYLSREGTLLIAPALEKQLVRLPLRAKVYLDKAGGAVTARTQFCYGDTVIDPFSPKDDRQEAKYILRDGPRERAVTDLLAAAGFRVLRGQVYLSEPDALYDFLTGGAEKLTAVSEVFFSKEFRRMAPRRGVFRGTMRMARGKLMLELSDGEENIEDLRPLMEALRDRRRYFQYKNGDFLSLEGAENFAPLAEELCQIPGDLRDLNVCRAAYLRALIDQNALPVTVDESARRVSEISGESLKSPVKGLRPYQETGFGWLCELRALKMGGVLADDMGLGKTVQTIAALAYCREKEGKWPSLLVAPTSLVYNWQSELKRFAPKLTVLVLASGMGQQERAGLIAKLKNDAPDVVITSYPLIRRDIDLIGEFPFRFAILDEAQFIKNASSVGARAVKRLTAETRLALTGTPMENHPGELWSIFDFVLPGYLPSLPAFMRRYGEGQDAEDLKNRIRPFLLRRVKGDVLTELPDKLEEDYACEMPPSQRRVYQAALMQKRERVGEILRAGGGGQGRAEVLAAITMLRQICCHPRLCLPDYDGESGKLELLMDILPPALAVGHRALIFSQFTRMLKIIEERLSQEGIESLYLDGETPAAERLTLAQRFNAGEKSVFLVSLKAGGTGLNLTGADMVICYDPWWNPSAEDQAIDRAHRIGQTRSVQVARLTAHGTIEEKVVGMGRRKRQLFDQLITPGERMPGRLSDEDILRLFDDT